MNLEVPPDAVKEMKQACGKVHEMTTTPYWYVRSLLLLGSIFSLGILIKRRDCGDLFVNSHLMQHQRSRVREKYNSDEIVTSELLFV